LIPAFPLAKALNQAELANDGEPLAGGADHDQVGEPDVEPPKANDLDVDRQLAEDQHVLDQPAVTRGHGPE
jgi:hypothetical protein